MGMHDLPIPDGYVFQEFPSCWKETCSTKGYCQHYYPNQSLLVREKFLFTSKLISDESRHLLSACHMPKRFRPLNKYDFLCLGNQWDPFQVPRGSRRTHKGSKRYWGPGIYFYY